MRQNIVKWQKDEKNQFKKSEKKIMFLYLNSLFYKLKNHPTKRMLHLIFCSTVITEMEKFISAMTSNNKGGLYCIFLLKFHSPQQ